MKKKHCGLDFCRYRSILEGETAHTHLGKLQKKVLAFQLPRFQCSCFCFRPWICKMQLGFLSIQATAIQKGVIDLSGDYPKSIGSINIFGSFFKLTGFYES